MHLPGGGGEEGGGEGGRGEEWRGERGWVEGAGATMKDNNYAS